MAKNASDGQEGAEEFKNSLSVLRRRKLFFAIGMNGSTPVIKTHLKQKPKKLRREAKSAGAGPKGCSGEMTLNGKVLELYCIEESVPDNIAKLTTKWLRGAGMQFRAEVMPQTIPEPEDEEDDEDGAAESEATARQATEPGAEAESPGQRASAEEASEAATEEAAETLREVGNRAAAAPGGGAAAMEEEEEPMQASAEAPADRTASQEQLLAGLQDIKMLLQQVSQQGGNDDVARMQKFGALFKKALKSNDMRVGQKVLDGMRQLASRVDANAKATQRRSQARAGRMKQMGAGLKNLIRELS